MKKHKFELPENGLTEKEKEKIIIKASKYYGKFMDVLLPGWKEDVNSKDTPLRVTKAFVNDIAKGLYNPPPKITAFDNLDNYSGIVLQSNIPVQSLCSHHHQNIIGIAHVAYIPNENGKIIGLSKLNRIVEMFSRTPQVQENLTQQIHDVINEICEKNSGVAVIIKAKHLCVGHRGVNQNSDMSTAVLSGDFKLDDKVRSEFYKLVEYASN
ncbi:MAG: GTP cyclohydrolase I [Bacteroidia bacterium]